MISVRFVPVLATLVALLPAPVANAAAIPGFVAVPYQVIDNRYVLRCTLNGKPLNMVIDSGASITVIDRDAFNRCIPKAEQVVPKGVPTKISGNGVNLPVLLAKNLQFGAMKFGDGPVAVADLSRNNIDARHSANQLSIAGFESVVIDGLIGLDILRSYNVVLNTTSHILYINSDRSKRGGLLGDHMATYGFTRVRMKMARGGILETPCTLDGKPGDLIVDTGAWLSIVDYQFARKAGVSLRPTLMKMGLGIGGQGSTAVFVAQPKEFKIGDFAFRDLSIASQGLEYGMMGLFGPEMMEKGHAILDFGNLSMFLK